MSELILSKGAAVALCVLIGFFLIQATSISQLGRQTEDLAQRTEQALTLRTEILNKDEYNLSL